MDLLNDSIGFVERFHWFCFGKLPLLLLSSAILTDIFWRFRKKMRPSSPVVTIAMTEPGQHIGSPPLENGNGKGYG